MSDPTADSVIKAFEETRNRYRLPLDLFCETLIREVRRLRNSYRCYSCKQTFDEDHGNGLASEHFGSWLKGDSPRCEDCLKGTATWGGGPHDPFYRVRKEVFDAMESEIATLKARCARYEENREAEADELL